MKINIKKFSLVNSLPIMGEAFDLIDSNRSRLEPWFWWTSAKVTPTKTKAIIFMLLYLLDTKRKEIAYKFDSKKLYDEQFLIFVDNKFGGMTGLDNIDVQKRDAEIWYFVSSDNEGHGIATETIKFMSDYSLNHNKLNSIYAKINTQNNRSINLVKRNGFVLDHVEYGIPTSRRNPKIADIMTWTKQLVK